MIGAIAEAHCGQVPPHIAGRIPSFLPQELLGITVRSAAGTAFSHRASPKAEA